MVPTHKTLRAFATALPDVTNRRSRSDTAEELVTNGKCFVSLPDEDPGVAYAVASMETVNALVARQPDSFARAEGLRGTWIEIRLGSVAADDLERIVLDGWRLRAQKRSQYAYLGPKFFADIEPILSELRSWPELTETSTGHFSLDGKQFLHFHYGWMERHSDAKAGDEWGPPIPIPLGRPNKAAVSSFLAEVRRRLELIR